MASMRCWCLPPILIYQSICLRIGKAGKKSAKDALDSIVKRGNEQLERFEKANKS